MADTFNPQVEILRLHWFSVRPCFPLLDPASCTPFARKFMSEEQYYREDQMHPPFFELRRLGKRSQQERSVGTDSFSKNVFRPHGFWSLYMSRVAHPDYRGVWKGLAPMRVVFRSQPSGPLVRIRPEFAESLKAQISRLKAYPTCYIFPIGWVAGLVIQAEGDFPLASVSGLVDRLRSELAFVGPGGTSLPLDRILRGLHDRIREEFVAPKTSPTLEQDGNPYLVISPLKFENQNSFDGLTKLDASKIAPMLVGGPLSNENKLLITPGDRFLTMTALNRGTLAIASNQNQEPNVPGCSSSNFKNSLMTTMLMQKYHQNSRDHKSALVAAMRGEVVETFAQLENFWCKPYFRKICDAHTGIQKLRIPETPNGTGVGPQWN